MGIAYGLIVAAWLSIILILVREIIEDSGGKGFQPDASPFSNASKGEPLP